MKHVNLAFTCCYGCPFCDHDVEVYDGKNTIVYWCQKLQTNAHSSLWGEDGVLPGCPLDEYEPRDGDQIDKYYHLTRKVMDLTQVVIDLLERHEDLLQYAEDRFVDDGEHTNPEVLCDLVREDSDTISLILEQVDWKRVADYVMGGMKRTL